MTTSLLAAGAQRNYAAVVLRAEDFRAHMPQDVYCQIAAQIDWRGLVRERILRLAADAGLATEGVETAGNDDLYGSLTEEESHHSRGSRARSAGTDFQADLPAQMHDARLPRRNGSALQSGKRNR